MGWREQASRSSSMTDVVRARLEDPDHRRKRIARAKERRAFLVLGIVMASFVGCWLPFFFIYLVTSSHRYTCVYLRLPGDVVGWVTTPEAARDAVRRVFLAWILQLGVESNHLHYL